MEYKIDTLGQFHQPSTSSFCANILAPKNYKAKLQAQKFFGARLLVQKLLVKCWWNRHLVSCHWEVGDGRDEVTDDDRLPLVQLDPDGDEGVEDGANGVHHVHDATEFWGRRHLDGRIVAGTNEIVEVFRSRLDEGEYPLSNEAEPDDDHVEEQDPEVVENQRRVLDSENEEVLANDDEVKEKERLDD